MIHHAFTQDCFKILTIFASSPGSRWQRKHLQEMSLLPNRRLDNALAQLLASVLIKEKRLYSVDFERGKELLAIVTREYKQLRELPFNIYFALLDVALLFAPSDEAYLFGSYAKLVYKEGSDLDIAVVSDNDFGKRFHAILLNIEKRYGISIEVHFFTKNEFDKERKDPLVKEIKKDGIKIYG